MSETHKAITITGQRIKCDGAGCDFFDETVTRESFPQWIDKPCPKCGKNLLTKDGAEAAKKAFAFADFVNAMIGDIPAKVPATAVPLTVTFGEGGFRSEATRRYGGGGA